MGNFERNGTESLDCLGSVESFPRDGLLQSMSTTYFSMLCVVFIFFHQYVSSLVF